ncbi:T9SS type A sorting domain-containing protein [Flavobacterium sp. CBA20B-1]|uniref:M43 family zinc metalloprotease n=1 Tax=unclassified Flavobacterium TaxID=196869 RepID=UPI00222559C8|nr:MULTISPECIES: M43 family zinc metalloprotease [unclassified Flavobacterium]WCM43094.1 T9SS type A sorting domain-containing protein [Flavobacterium sp. CBA20B-1]
MKELLTLALLFFTIFVKAQSENTLDSCGTIYTVEENYDSDFEKFYQSKLQLQSKNPVTYYIPVVFHIIHIGEPLGYGSNIADIEVYKALERLNNNFKNNHNHPNNSNTSIQFVLATKAPDGSCSNGINRVNFGSNQNYVEYGNAYRTTDNGVDAATIRSLSNWNSTQYYNIWVVNKITAVPGVGGYAYYPTEHGTTHDGTFIYYQYLIFENNPVFTHELGHSLNLMHTFQGSTGTNCPAQVNGCGADGDCISDTPPHSLNHADDLVLNAPNICSGDNNSTYKHNYMSYARAAYRNVFTPMQITRMQSATTFYRSSYLPANNSVFTMTQKPQAQFYINESNSNYKQFFCAGTPINLKNSSTCFLNTFNNTPLANYTSKWVITKNGQTLYTTTEPNPTITLNQAGTYSITLTAKNNIGASTLTKNVEIVANTNNSYCTPTSLNVGYSRVSVNSVRFYNIYNTSEIGVNLGYKDYSCTHITQAPYDKMNSIEIIVTSNQVYFNQILHGYIDYNDNGVFETYELIFQQIVPSMVNNMMYTFTFTPPSNVIKGKILRMRIISDNSNITASKLDCSTAYKYGDIEDYGVIFESYLSTADLGKEKYNIYPNPAENVLNINSTNFDEKSISIYSSAGQLIKSIKANDEDLSIDISELSSGTYILKINNFSHTFIKK